ncbi:MAG: hypothetical protein H0T79_18725 [Deltaproteobacteria bacterium]|nr:hypothetical protein [Deltaproteobacteria bacterium]
MSEVLDELLGYVQFDAADRARLVALHEVLAPRFPDVAGRFYDAVFANASTAELLSGPAQVERLRISLVDWMSSGLLGPYDARFYEKRSRIGRRHVQIGLGQQYMFTAINVVRGAYLDEIRALYTPDAALDTLRSVDKLMDIELALMLRHYQLDSEERLLARERQLQIDRMTALQTMTAGLAHEVRNPLNAAKLQLELLERRLRRESDDPRYLEPTQLAHQEIERLSMLLDEFLAFARPPALDAHEHDVVEIVRHVVELEHPIAQRDGTELGFAPTATALARIDPRKVHQIVQNLLRNALEAAAPNGHVGVSVRTELGSLHIRITDDGHGIPPGVQARIYEPFFSTKEGGTGMGMSIVHNFVAMHGGTIDITSGASGTVVDVALPRRR